MSLHYREQILEAIKDNLLGITLGGSNCFVFRARVKPLAPDEFPALVLYQAEENVEFIENQQADRKLNFRVEIYVRDSANVETDLNYISAQVATNLLTDVTQGLSFIIDTHEQLISAPSIDHNGAVINASMDINFMVHYRSNTVDPRED